VLLTTVFDNPHAMIYDLSRRKQHNLILTR